MGTAKVTEDMAKEALRSFHWKAVDAMTDEDIARQVSDNPDATPLLTDRGGWIAVPVVRASARFASGWD